MILFKKLLFTVFILNLPFTIMAQNNSSYLYELKLRTQFAHQNNWTEKEKFIQNQHIQYLDSLTKKGVLEMGGIIDQGLENHLGVVILNVHSFEEARKIALNDPSVKEGMMTAHIRPLQIYFRRKKEE